MTVINGNSNVSFIKAEQNQAEGGLKAENDSWFSKKTQSDPSDKSTGFMSAFNSLDLNSNDNLRLPEQTYELPELIKSEADAIARRAKEAIDSLDDKHPVLDLMGYDKPWYLQPKPDIKMEDTFF